MNQWFLLAIAIMIEVVATSMLKLSNGFTRLMPSLAAIIGYAISFYCLAQTLRTIPVGIAYAIWSGAGIVCISLIAWLKFNQKLDFAAIIGMIFIIIGVLIINLLSKSVSH